MANSNKLNRLLFRGDMDGIAALFERLTGRKPTQAELAEAMTDMHRGQDQSSKQDAGALPEAQFGDVNGGGVDWRAQDDGSPDLDDDVLEQTPEDVVAMLGFDPLELENDEP